MEWNDVYHVYFDEEEPGEVLLGKFMQEIVLSKPDFRKFFYNAIDGKFHQHYESHFIHMPVDIIESEKEGYGKYEGYIRISWNNFDDREHIGSVRLDKFCFYTKLAALFHAKYVDTSFDPWDCFQKLDAMQRKYFPQP